MRNGRVFAEGLLIHVGKAGFIQSQVARCAAVDNAQIREPNLVNAWLESATQAHGISAIANQPQVSPLKTMPLAEVILCRCDRKQQ
jgi:hypothetical protein